jgi:DNA polymerase III subunit delta'
MENNTYGFSGIIGHEQLIEHLKGSIEAKRVSHAYILEGAKGSGKGLLAKAFAMTLLCEKEQTEPCMECHSCKQIMHDAQPDLIYVSHEKPRTITVDDIRSQLVADVAIRPEESKYKVYIIDEAEKMNEAAQNALLKTIEEPPEYAVILLLTTSASVFLPTITSRCVTLTLRPVADKQIVEFLKEKGIEEEKAKICAAFAQGVPGKAVMLAQSEDFSMVKESAIRLLKRIAEIDTAEMAQQIRRINEFHMDLTDYLDILVVWYRDVLQFKATQDANGLIFKDEVLELKRQSNRISYSGIEEIIDALQKAKERLRANVNYDLTMELLLSTIKENQK